MKSPLPFLVAVVAVALLAGCTPDEPVVIPEPEPSSAPIFESDEEALAAAEFAYGEYLRVSDAILADGGSEPDRVDAVASESFANIQKDSYAEARELGQRGTGTTAFDSMELQQYDSSAAEGDQAVTAYACLDLSDTDFLDATGKSVVLPSRQDRVPVELAFDGSEDTTSGLVLSSLEVWTGDNFCES